MDLVYNITKINRDATGVIEFSRPINMVWLKKNFYDMFRIYYRDNNYDASAGTLGNK